MINVDKQIQYWVKGADSNVETAEILIKKKKITEGLFFCHLCIEKILKALVVKKTKNIPPYIHKLSYLADKAKISLTEDQLNFFTVLMKYQLEGRYPEYLPEAPRTPISSEYLKKTKQLLICLKKKL